MSIWNKILIGLIITFSLVFFYMSARMLKTQKYWSDLAQKHEAAINTLQKEDDEKVTEIDQIRGELNKLTVDRQRVWYNCDPQVNINRQSGAVTIKVTVDQPNPSGIANKTILYAFEDAPTAKKGRLLGEFKVTAVADKQITLEPAFKLMPVDLDKLATAKRPWNLYDSLPHDSHEIFAQLSEQDKKAMLPADSAAEYIDDGVKNSRPLRDYALLFDVYHMKITELVDQEQSALRDRQMVEDTLTDAQRQVQFYQKQATIFQAILAKLVQQRDAVKAHLDKLREKLAEAKAAVEKFIENNKAMAGQIAKIQLDATRRIDQRTRAMAQSANGEN